MATVSAHVRERRVESSRLSILRKAALVAAALLFLKVLLSILLEYRWYFPANFESAFLSGRRYTFVGLYRAAFYAHILCGPVAIVLGSLLMISGGRRRFGIAHRIAGRAQILIVIVVLVPSGLVMASQAYAGPIAACGFALLSIATATCAVATVLCARGGRLQAHQRWATRCFLLLCSPLLLRVITGAVIVLDLESDWSYRLNAWVSWLIPLVIYESWSVYSRGRAPKLARVPAAEARTLSRRPVHE